MGSEAISSFLVQSKHKVWKRQKKKKNSLEKTSHKLNCSVAFVLYVHGQHHEAELFIAERQGLQTQCRTAIMKWNEAEKELHLVRGDRDQYKKSLSQAMNDNRNVSDDLWSQAGF